MHPPLPKETIDLYAAQRGRRFIFAPPAPSRTALVVVDMQNGFVSPTGALAVPDCPDIVPNINKMAAALRTAGGTVIWIISTFGPDPLQAWHFMFNEFMNADVREEKQKALYAGAEGHKIWSDLKVEPGDLTISKNRFSALIQGSSDLDAQLRARGIEHVIITGTLTNVCCESTGRDAMMLGYRVTMLSDGNAAPSDDLHHNSLKAFGRTFGDVMTTDEMIGRLQGPF